MKKNYCYFNGKIIDIKKVKISPYDLGMMRGYGVFDVMCTQNGKPFLFDYHWWRVNSSAKELNMKMPLNKKEFKKVVEKLLKLNKHKKSIIRTVITGGVTSDGFTLEKGKETFYILIEKFVPLPSEVFEKGAKIVTLDFKRHLPYLKVTNYVAAIKNQDLKMKEKALEILYIRSGIIYEASTANIFIVKNKKIITPHDDVLLGTTRRLVMDLAEKAGYKVERREVKLKELHSADEAFLTAANKDVVPVVRVDGKTIGNGKIGKETKILMDAFEDFAKKY